MAGDRERGGAAVGTDHVDAIARVQRVGLSVAQHRARRVVDADGRVVQELPPPTRAHQRLALGGGHRGG